MKIKDGFVSNSSSSSFIVAFEFKPKCKYDLERMIFGEIPEGEMSFYKNPYYYPNEEKSVKGWRGDVVASIVWRELFHQSAMTRKAVLREIRSGWFPGYPEYNLFADDKFDEEDGDSEEIKKLKIEAQEKYYEEEDANINAASEKLLDEFIETFPEKIEFYTFEYCDNEGEMFSAMEHGNLFGKFNYIKIDKH